MFGGLEYLTLLSDLISRGTDRYYAVIGQIVNPLRSVEKILVIWYGLFYRPQATERLPPHIWSRGLFQFLCSGMR